MKFFVTTLVDHFKGVCVYLLSEGNWSCIY